MMVWRLKSQTVENHATCRSGWTMKHNGRNVISLLLPNLVPGPAGPFRLQNQNNKKDMLCVTR